MSYASLRKTPTYSRSMGDTTMKTPAVQGTVIDAHAHLGNCRIFEASVTEDALLTAMEGAGVGVSLVMPYPGADDPVEVHDQIAAFASAHPGRIFGVANHSPHGPKYRDEARRCIEELGFVALKLHTMGHAVNPLSVDGAAVVETAATLNVPVIVHTGPGAPFALPSLCIPLARRFPEVSIVLAHAGHTIYNAEAIVTAQECPNVYLETSWLHSKQIKAAVDALGAHRVMMGSDGPGNLQLAMAQFAAARLAQDDLEASLSLTAARVFRLPIGA